MFAGKNPRNNRELRQVDAFAFLIIAKGKMPARHFSFRGKHRPLMHTRKPLQLTMLDDIKRQFIRTAKFTHWRSC
jgi:hypothetical protein